MQMQCPNCGSIFPEGTKFCSKCGSNLVGTQPAMNNNLNQNSWQQNQPYQQPYAPYGGTPNNGGGNNVLLYVIIGILVAVILGGTAYFFISRSNSEKEELELLKKNQEELASKNQELAEQNAKLAESKKDTKIIINKGAEHASEHRAVSAGGRGAKVVINGTGVRLRFAPSLDAGYLTWANGATRAPRKGAKLEYRGEDSDWYEVRYLGHTFYVSKEYSYLEY